MSSPCDDPDTQSFSICIPVYNGRRYLADTLASVRAQTYSNWELIVWEDGSPEPSRDIVETFATTVSQKVTYLTGETNLGCARAHSLAIDHANSPWIAMLDSDDLWATDHLARLAEILAREEADFVFSGFALFSDDPSRPFLECAPAPETLEDLRTAYFFRRYWLQPSSVAFTRRLIDRVGPWDLHYDKKPAWLPSPNLGEDYNFFLRVIHSGHCPHWTGATTVSYRKHDNACTAREQEGDIYTQWFIDYHGPMPGVPRWPQLRLIGQLLSNAARDLQPRSRILCARFYLRAWLRYPPRIDRIGRALLALIPK